MASPFANLTAADFFGLAKRLFPPGRAFRFIPGGLQEAIALAMGDVAYIGHAADIDSLDIENNPSLAVQTFDAWLADYGLPDPCIAYGASEQELRADLLGRIASVGGQSDAYLISVAAAMGFTITITHDRTSRAGIAVAGDPLCGPEADFMMVVNAADVPVIWSVAGQASAGDPINYAATSALQCRLSQIAPADVYLSFVYGSS